MIKKLRVVVGGDNGYYENIPKAKVYIGSRNGELKDSVTKLNGLTDENGIIDLDLDHLEEGFVLRIRSLTMVYFECEAEEAKLIFSIGENPFCNLADTVRMYRDNNYEK